KQNCSPRVVFPVPPAPSIIYRRLRGKPPPSMTSRPVIPVLARDKTEDDTLDADTDVRDGILCSVLRRRHSAVTGRSRFDWQKHTDYSGGKYPISSTGKPLIRGGACEQLPDDPFHFLPADRLVEEGDNRSWQIRDRNIDRTG